MRRLAVGDEVLVIRGDDKGKRGKITRIIREKDAVVIEGINSVKRHMKPTPQRPGGILEVEAAIAASKVMLIDPKTGKPTRVRFKTENDQKVRVSKSGETVAVQRG
jgi:large subunit ribosomal protein L24